MSKPTFLCPNCNNNSTYTQESSVTLNSQNYMTNKYHVIWRCDVCDNITYKIFNYEKVSQGTYTPPKITYTEDFQYPYGFIPMEQALHEKIAHYLIEAHNCFKIGSLRASSAMCRSTISAICDDFGVSGVDLKEKINSLPLSKRLIEVAKNIKWLGDKTLHNEIDWINFKWKKETVNEMLNFITRIIDDLYTQERKSKELANMVSKTGKSISKIK